MRCPFTDGSLFFLWESDTPVGGRNNHRIAAEYRFAVERHMRETSEMSEEKKTLSIMHARHASRKPTERPRAAPCDRRIRNFSTLRATLLSPLPFFFILLLITLRARASFAPPRELRFSVESISAARGRSEIARCIADRRGDINFILPSCFSCRDSGVYERGSRDARCNYYVRMRDLRSRHVVCILLVARNRFMIPPDKNRRDEDK